MQQHALKYITSGVGIIDTTEITVQALYSIFLNSEMYFILQKPQNVQG